jgi:hypothetical protein
MGVYLAQQKIPLVAEVGLLMFFSWLVSESKKR